MLLKDLLAGLDAVHIMGSPLVNINGLSCDSRHTRPGDLFFSLPGKKTDGHFFISEALEKGAAAIVVNRHLNFPVHATYVLTNDVRKVMAVASRNFYRQPDREMSLIGVTGTNGKTTTATLLAHLLRCGGKNTGLISTVENWLGNTVYPSEHTTPEAPALYALLREMADAGSSIVVVEVSSHGLALKRLHGCRFQIGIFTNLTHEHFDFHGGFGHYLESKKKLFDLSLSGLINKDDRFFSAVSSGLAVPFHTYSLKEKADYCARDIKFGGGFFTAHFILKGFDLPVRVPLYGMYNVYNALAAAGAAWELGISAEKIAGGLLSFAGVEGRMEKIEEGQPFRVIVDYAHTPDGLAQLLEALRADTKGKLILVFGCRGERDALKRPVMGEISAKWTELCFITNDSPFGEDPAQILKAIEEGYRSVKKEGYSIQPERRKAIKEAIFAAGPEDTVVVTGRGHEKFLFQGGQKIPFDDREVLREAIHERMNKREYGF